jgi:hypothetical protein
VVAIADGKHRVTTSLRAPFNAREVDNNIHRANELAKWPKNFPKNFVQNVLPKLKECVQLSASNVVAFVRVDVFNHHAYRKQQPVAVEGRPMFQG